MDRKILKYLSMISQVGISMAIPVVGCILLGHFLDERFGTGVLWLVVFTLLGVMTSFRNLYTIAKKF